MWRQLQSFMCRTFVLTDLPGVCVVPPSQYQIPGCSLVSLGALSSESLSPSPLSDCHWWCRWRCTVALETFSPAMTRHWQNLSLLRLTIWHTHTVSQDKCAVGRCCRGNDARSPGLTWKYKNRNVSIKCCKLWSKEIILHIYIVFIKIIVFFGSHLVFVNFRAAETDLEGGQLHVFPCFYSLTEDQTGLYITGSTTRGLTGGSL